MKLLLISPVNLYTLSELCTQLPPKEFKSADELDKLCDMVEEVFRPPNKEYIDKAREYQKTINELQNLSQINGNPSPEIIKRLSNAQVEFNDFVQKNLKEIIEVEVKDDSAFQALLRSFTNLRSILTGGKSERV